MPCMKCSYQGTICQIWKPENYFADIYSVGITYWIRCVVCEYKWVRSRRCSCLVTWFCYQLIAKPGNKTAAPSWPDPYVYTDGLMQARCYSIANAQELSVSCTNPSIYMYVYVYIYIKMIQTSLNYWMHHNVIQMHNLYATIWNSWRVNVLSWRKIPIYFGANLSGVCFIQAVPVTIKFAKKTFCSHKN